MADNKATQTQQTSPDAVRMFEDEWSKLARQAIDEMARLGHSSLAYAAQMGAEWRKLFVPRA